MFGRTKTTLQGIWVIGENYTELGKWKKVIVSEGNLLLVIPEGEIENSVQNILGGTES